MSAVYGAGGESDAIDIALFLYCIALSRITLPGKPKGDKPQVRAEPGEPKALTRSVPCASAWIRGRQ